MEHTLKQIQTMKMITVFIFCHQMLGLFLETMVM